MQGVGDGSVSIQGKGLRDAWVPGDCEAWPYLDEGVLRFSRSRKVCMTCHWFRHHAGPQCILLLTCQLHQGLIAQGEHLIRRCQGWTDDMARQRGWAPDLQASELAKAKS